MVCKGSAPPRRIWCVFQVQHTMPSILKILGQREPLRPCFASFHFRNPCLTEKACKRHFPTGSSSWVRSFPLRSVAVIFFCQIGISFFPVFITAPSHDFLPVSSTLGIVRAASHLPSCNFHSFHSQLQLLSHNQPRPFSYNQPSPHLVFFRR